MFLLILELLVTIHPDIAGTQYIPNTLCSTLYFGTCRPTCFFTETQQINSFANLCNGEVCCRPRQGSGGSGPVPTGTWLTWSAWSTCSVSCGQGIRRRTRQCRDGVCVGPSTFSQLCDRPQCPLVEEPLIGQWTAWSACSSTCGAGRRFRFRRCVGQQCPELPILEINDCNIGPCLGTTTSTSTTSFSTTQQISTTTESEVPVGKNCPPAASRAIGVSDVDFCRDNPWTVHFDLYRNFRNRSQDGNLQIPFCNGVLLSRATILTTRTCSMGIEAVHTDTGINVVAFAGSLADGTQMRNISKIRSANASNLADINLAIVAVSSPFTLDACAVPACLPDATDEFSEISNCRITGWEPATEPGNELIVSSVQREASVSFVPTSICRDTYSRNHASNVTVHSDTVCSQPLSRQEASTCEMDNGWMLVCEDNANRPTVVGLSSTSPCNPNLPSTFQAVQPHTNWIHSAQQQLELDSA